MSTTAIVFAQAGKVALQEIEIPAPRPGQVRIRTEYSSISAGTEGWVMQNRFTWAATPFPCVPGYQRVGTIVALGPDVIGWKPGDRVMATIGQWEGAVVSFWGAHAAEANTPAGELYRLPPGIDPIDASAAVVAQVGYNAANRVHLQPGDWVVVYGDGIIGQFAAQAARARGAKVILIGHRKERLTLAARHSADGVVNSHDGHVVEAVKQQMRQKFATAVLDTIQRETVQREYLPLLEPGRGQIVYCGFTPGQAWADMGLLQQQELTTHFVSGWNRPRMEATLVLMAQRKMCLSPLLTHRVAVTQGPAMYRMIDNKSESFLGITLDWTGESQ